MTHVVVGIIINNEDPISYLLVSSNRDFGKYTGFYYPPSGHVESGETEISALEREIQEELNLQIKTSKKIAETMGDIKDQITSWYLCEVENYDLEIDKKELKNAGFFTQKDIETMNIWPATKKIFEEYIFKK